MMMGQMKMVAFLGSLGLFPRSHLVVHYSGLLVMLLLLMTMREEASSSLGTFQSLFARCNHDAFGCMVTYGRGSERAGIASCYRSLLGMSSVKLWFLVFNERFSIIVLTVRGPRLRSIETEARRQAKQIASFFVHVLGILYPRRAWFKGSPTTHQATMAKTDENRE